MSVENSGISNDLLLNYVQPETLEDIGNLIPKKLSAYSRYSGMEKIAIAIDLRTKGMFHSCSSFSERCTGSARTRAINVLAGYLDPKFEKVEEPLTRDECDDVYVSEAEDEKEKKTAKIDPELYSRAKEQFNELVQSNIWSCRIARAVAIGARDGCLFTHCCCGPFASAVSAIREKKRRRSGTESDSPKNELKNLIQWEKSKTKTNGENQMTSPGRHRRNSSAPTTSVHAASKHLYGYGTLPNVPENP